MSFELILPFLRPIEPLLLDDSISEIMGNPDASWWYERDGILHQEKTVRFDGQRLRTGLEVIANQLGKHLDEDNPLLHAQLPDGSRLAAVIPPVVRPSPALTIRKFPSRHFTVDDLIARGTLTLPLAGFAPTSRAAHQLRDAGIHADTLQSFLARGERRDDPGARHLYMVDESSLASTKHMRDFLERTGPQDRVLLIGDTRQHQGVDAGKPFEQLIEAGMHTARLDQIVRQKDPELLRAVEHLAKGEVVPAIAALEQQGRITEIVDPQQRIAAIAKNYVAHPENTLIVSPDNTSRREINQVVRQELQVLGLVDKTDHAMRVLTPSNDMTGAERAWAAHYQAGDVLHYIRGSKELGIERGSYAQVVATNPKENLVTVQKQDGDQVTYDPSRLRGISAYQEIEREFAVGDRIQFTVPNRALHVANRDLGTIEHIGQDGQFSVRMDNGKAVVFDANEMRHLDHGYAVTSYSSQGLTSERVLVNMDTEVHPDLINSRFAYVSVSRASHEAHIYTNHAASLTESLSHDTTKTSAVTFSKDHNITAEQSIGQSAGQPKMQDTGLSLTL